MSTALNMHGLLAVLEDLNADLVGRRENRFSPVPLTGVQLEVRFLEGVAEVSVVQDYVNREEKAIEVIYHFPVEEGAAVTKVEAEVDGGKVVGKVKEKETAREEYRNATSRGHTAVLVEEVKADIVQMKIGRLAAGAGCRVSLTYLFEAEVEEEKTRLTLPTTLAPRYCPPTHATPEAGIISNIKHTDSSPPLSLRLEVLARSPIVSIHSPSHSLVTRQEEIQSGIYQKVAHFKGTAVDMDRDVVVLVATEDGHRPRLLVEKGENSTAVLLTLVPRLEDLVKVPSEVVFLIDCSGSMQGQSILMAKEALNLLLNSLPTDSTFNIVRFGSRMEMLFPSSQTYTDSTLETARSVVRELNANLGGTEILTPLQAILNQPKEEGQRLKQLFILTDGAVSNSHECIRLVGGERKNTRVFTLGIGASADRHLVKGLARAGGGTAAFTTEGEQLSRKVLGQLSQALAPSLYPVTIDWGLKVEDEGVAHCQVPRVPPAIFHGSRFSLFRLFSGDVKVGGKVVLKAGNTEQEMELESNPMLSGELLHKMFARRMIQELEEESQVGSKERELIKDLSLKYNIMSRFTSFIAVDQRLDKEEEMGEMLVRRVANMTPHRFGRVARCAARRSTAGSANSAAVAIPYSSSSGLAQMDMIQDPGSWGIQGIVPQQQQQMFQASPRQGLRSPQSWSSRCSLGMSKASLSMGGFSSQSSDSLLGCSKFAPRSEEEEDENIGFGLFSGNSKRAKVGAEMTLHEKMMALMALQTASGHFAEHKMIGDIVGKPLEDLKACVPDSKPGSMKSWLTAIVIAFLELSCLEEKGLWHMSVEKARAALLERGFVENAKKVIAQF